ncbi:MAG: aminotransferase DegT [Puniceicoccaceae bacterium]|nr:aminotransferase DegT [Puniceicoccaceae bacterium]|tara:strand:- start:14113 stop:15237 length:1125 start_codon:yes stop_codon:yes gene_type:complete
MQFIDIKAIHAHSAAQIDAAVAKVFEHGRYINGPEVYELEATLGEFLGDSQPLHCIAVASGTMALEVALRALGIGPGDEVITTPFTWISTAETIALVGATPVFVDIAPDTYNIDPVEVEKAITPKTKAIIPVDLFGQLPDYTALEAIAEKHGLKIIEDAAQSFGAEQNGRKAGTFGNVATTSFFPAKPLGGYGDGGAVFTADEQLAEDLRAVTNHGCKERESHYILGTNGRCDSLQAAVIQAKFANFRDEEIALRQQVGARYSEALKEYVTVPTIQPGNTHIYAQYTIRPQNRDSLGEVLKAADIPSAVYYRKPLHQQAVFSHLPCAKKSFPNTEKAAKEVISLPFHPYLSESDQDRIVEAVIQKEILSPKAKL